MMHVVYCFDHRYEQHFGASVVSLLLHLGGPGSELCVHVVTADPSDGFQARLDRLTDRFRARITVHRVHAQDVAQVSNLQLMKTPTGHLTAATYYRVLLGSILPPDIDRVLYLDADTIVLSDLRPLVAAGPRRGRHRCGPRPRQRPDGRQSVASPVTSTAACW